MSVDVVDSHVHFWDVTKPWYPALKEMSEQIGMPKLFTSFDANDYRTESGGLPVTGMVHVSAVTMPNAHLRELEWVVNEMAAAPDMRYVGTTDPTLDSTEMIDDLNAQLAVTEDLAGIRVLYGLDPESSATSTLLGWLTEHDLVFDLVCGPADLPAWTARLKRSPELRVVLEHCGWPAGPDDVSRAAWRSAMQRFAEATSSVCKLSGLGMIGDLTPTSLRPWIEEAIGMFGWKRVMFGSNMPMERMGGEFTQLLSSLDEIVGPASLDERKQFYSATAANVYGFEVK